MAVDGHLNFDTKVDTSEVEKASAKIEAEAKTTGNKVKTVANETEQKIQDVLNDTEKSAKSKAASIASIYKKQGLSQSEAMKKAWSQIERHSSSSNDKIKKKSKSAGKETEKAFKKASDNSSKSFDNMGSRISSAFKKIGVVVASAFAVGKIIDFGKQSVELASDLQEVQNVVDTAFGAMSEKMEQFAETSIETYGISKLAAKQTGSTFMAMASGMGIATAEASDMAIALTGLSADMASFYNVEQSVASTALKSVFTGETETLKQFGIVMTEANLEAFALSQGISKSVSEMTQAEKVQLRYNYVMQQTSLAQGDFAKTSDSWANQTRIMSEQFKELGSTVGTLLMNVLLPAVKAINTALSSLISWAGKAAQAIADVFGIEMQTSTAAGIFNEETSDVADNYSDIADSAEATQEANERSLASFDKITKLDEPSADSADTTTASVTALPSAITLPTVTQKVDVDTSSAGKKLKDLFNTVKTTLQNVGKFIKDNFGGIFSGIWDGLKGEGLELWGTFNDIFSDLETLVEPFKKYLAGDFTVYLQTAFSTIGTIVVGLLDSFNKVFSDIWNLAVYPIVSKFITTVLPMITQFYTEVTSTLGELFNAVKEIFDRLWAELVAPVIEWVTSVITDVFDLLKEKWDEWGKPTFDNIKETIETIKELFLSAWENVLKPCFDKIMEVVDKIWKEHLQPLVSEFLDFVGELVNGAMKIYNKFIAPIVKWLIEKLGPVVTFIFGKIADKVGETIGNIIDAVKGIIRAIKGIVQFVTGVFTGDWKKAWEGVKNIFGGIWDTISNLLANPVNAIVDVLNWLLGKVEDFINWIIEAINKINIDVPDWLAKKIGIEDVGFNLDTVNIPEIPKLATGTVVPANYGEFLAVLGDNKREPEVVSPLSTMEQALDNVIQKRGGIGGDIVIHYTAELNGKKVHKEVVRINKQEIRKTGHNPLAPVPVM